MADKTPLTGPDRTEQRLHPRRRGVVRRMAFPAVLSLVLGCAPALEEQALTFPFAKGWQGRVEGAPRLMDDRQWWAEGLQDPVLTQLVARAIKGSPDLAASRARAEAALRAAEAVPGALGLSGGAGAPIQITDRGISSRSLSADLGFDVLFDPGRSREAQRLGARAQASEAMAQHAAARLVLIGEVAQSYLSLRHAQQRLVLARAEAGRQRKTLELARTLAARGEGTRVESLRSEARMASLQAELPGLEAAVAREIVRLSVLVGDAPGALPPDLMAALHKELGQPRARLAPDPGLPADLLRNRPDLRLAEARYDAARAALGQSRAALYPRLSLGGTIELSKNVTAGSPATSLSSFGPSLRLPALPQGRTRASVGAAAKGVEAAHADWTARVLTALSEVETALIDHRASARTEAAAARAVGLHGEARQLMQQMTAAGEATLSDLISVEDALSNAESLLADARLARALAFVRLNLRLGSGS